MLLVGYELEQTYRKQVGKMYKSAMKIVQIHYSNSGNLLWGHIQTWEPRLANNALVDILTYNLDD